MKRYLHRMRSKGDCPPRKPTRSILWSWLGSLVGIYLIGVLTSMVAGRLDLPGGYVLGSFGAAAVLVYGAPLAEFSQPRNLVLGNLISAAVGVFLARNLPGPDSQILAAAIAVSSSVLCMHLTRTMHPPGGASALIAVVGGEHLQSLGYWYLLFPVLTGSVILLAGALIVNNLSGNPQRHYPLYWF